VKSIYKKALVSSIVMVKSLRDEHAVLKTESHGNQLILLLYIRLFYSLVLVRL